MISASRLRSTLAAKAFHHLHVRVDLAHTQGAALHVVFDACHAKSRQQRRHQHDGTAHLLGQVVALGVELRVLVVHVQDAAGVVHRHRAAQVRKISRILRTSVISGMPTRRTGSRVSSVAHRMGSTAFLLAEGVMRPVSGVPPCTMRLAMGSLGLKFGAEG
jgi:hypothetical protein